MAAQENARTPDNELDMTDRPTILLAHPNLASMEAKLSLDYEVVRLWESNASDRIVNVRAMIVMGDIQVSDDLINRMPKLGLIACFTVGYDGIDVAWAAKRGIAVTHAVGVNDEDVADHAIGLIIAQRRAIVAGDRRIREGQWDPRIRMRTNSLRNAKLGIVGLGSIGMAVAERAEAMRVEVSWWGPTPKSAKWPRSESLLELARSNEILVVAARSHPKNVGLISKEIIEALGPQGLLVNVARGQLIDEEALIVALKMGKLGAAALDVYEQEPTPVSRWADVPNTVLTPHTAGATHEAASQMASMVRANLAAFFASKPLPNQAT